MKRIPCRKCSQCGLYHNLAVEICTDCGTPIGDVPAELIDIDSLSKDELGSVDQLVTVYYQTCPECTTPNFTPDKNHRVMRCRKCNKVRIARENPILYILEDREDTDVDEGENGKNGTPPTVETRQHVPKEKTYPVNDESELDEEALFWLNKIKKSVGSHGNLDSQNMYPKEEASYSRETDDDDAHWPEELVGSLKEDASSGARRPAFASSAKRDITLTAKNYGHLSFTVEAEPYTVYRLGRSANQGKFLSQDDQVGREHCDLFFKNGNWYVKDNNSSNGTAVNDCDIGQNGECMLGNGDELKLGHREDSVTFTISIKP